MEQRELNKVYEYWVKHWIEQHIPHYQHIGYEARFNNIMEFLMDYTQFCHKIGKSPLEVDLPARFKNRVNAEIEESIMNSVESYRTFFEESVEQENLQSFEADYVIEYGIVFLLIVASLLKCNTIFIGSQLDNNKILRHIDGETIEYETFRVFSARLIQEFIEDESVFINLFETCDMTQASNINIQSSKSEEYSDNQYNVDSEKVKALLEESLLNPNSNFYFKKLLHKIMADISERLNKQSNQVHTPQDV